MYITYLYFIKHSDLQAGHELNAYSEEWHPVNHRGDFQRHARFSFHLQVCSQVYTAVVTARVTMNLRKWQQAVALVNVVILDTWREMCPDCWQGITQNIWILPVKETVYENHPRLSMRYDSILMLK